MKKFLAISTVVFFSALTLSFSAAAAKPQCMDRIDNDGDGLVDLADPGCSSKQDSSEVNTPPPTPDTTAPSQPTGSVTVVGETNLTLDWNASTDNVGVTGYEVLKNGALVTTTNASTTVYDFTGLTCGTSYTVAVRAKDAAGNTSTALSLTQSTSACSPPPTGSVTLTAVDGGTSYYSQFANGASMDASTYFPIGVWGSYNHTQANRDLDASAGINLYVWAADSAYMDQIRTDGRFKVIQDQGSRANVGTETMGWLLGDEWDMTGETCPGDVDAVKASLPADGRMRFFNYGKGLALPPGTVDGTTNWWADAAEQNCWINAVQAASNDFYWFTDPYEARYCCGFKYGDNITAMRNADANNGNRQPNWGFVETGDPWGNGTRSITPAEIRSAVWHTLIAGGRGIIYFQHSFGGPCGGDHHTIRSNCEGTRPMVTSVNAQVKSLAPVLNSPTVTSGFTASSNTRAMAKWDGSNFYVFAGATTAGGSGTFSIPCVGNATAEVVGESRSVVVTNGSFTDSFADRNAVHIYKIVGGSRCGL